MPKILVVDDERDMRHAISRVLEDGAFDVISASDGPTALELLKKDRVDVVLLDIRMPKLDGLQVLDRMKAMQPNLPVIMVTGYGNVKTAVQALQKGAFDYVEKPFDNQALIALIRKALAEQQLAQSPTMLEQDLAKQVTIPSRRSGRGGGAVNRSKPRWQREVREYRLVLSAVAAAAVIVGISWVAISRLWGWERKTFLVSYSNPSALSWDGTYLWTTDWLRQEFYCQKVGERFLEAVQVTKIGDRQASGLACATDALYVCDPIVKKIVKVKKDAALSVLGSVEAPGPSPCGLSWDGKALWSCDTTTKMMYLHHMDASLTVKKSFPVPSGRPAGLAATDREVWYLDADSKLVFQLTRSTVDQLTLKAKYRLPHDVASLPLSAFTKVGNHIWCAAEGISQLYVMKLSVLTPVP